MTCNLRCSPRAPIVETEAPITGHRPADRCGFEGPTAVLAAAGRLDGAERASVVYAVSEGSVRRAAKFEGSTGERVAA